MSKIIRFGIPSLDALFGESDPNPSNQGRPRQGILLPGSKQGEEQNSSISLCISGPDGTGKSVMGLHLVSRYAADCYAEKAEKLPLVLYVSTDLKFKMAKKIWMNFGLDYPNQRRAPFSDPENIKPEKLHLDLTNCTPLGSASAEAQPLAEYLQARPQTKGQKTPELKIFFIDLASKTAGDDWGFVSRVLSVLEEPARKNPRHLMVIDSVEGFETLVGERDAFGETQTRRSRVAQIMRAAADKCHTLLIVEEPEEGKRLPEEFVTDAVIRLRRAVIKGYIRRTLEIEKVRGHSHIRGQHAYLIRSGKGSTTGLNENYDDPAITAVKVKDRDTAERSDYQSYLHVCPSLHHLSREVMGLQGTGRPAKPKDRWAAFGIRYLDDILEGGNESFKRTEGNVRKEDFKRAEGDDRRGVQCSTVTALIGNSETKKSPLGYTFLSRCFREYVERFRECVVTTTGGAEKGKWKEEDEGRRRPRDNNERQARVLYRLEKATVSDKAEDRKDGDYAESGRKGMYPAWNKPIAPQVVAACAQLGPPRAPNDGIPVLLTTKDIHAHKLVRHFFPWLLRKVPALRKLDKDYPGCLAALRILLEEYTICRRLEIHDLPSSVLIHIVQQTIGAAQRILHGENVGQDTEKRFEQSWGIRVAIDDFSIMKDTYVEIRDEPLLLRYLVFYLGREGVTTLLIDTQPGRPDTTVASPLDSELRSLVDNSIYTWRFSFFGEDRVAIAPIPPISLQRPAVVRELREGKDVKPGFDITPLVVDPHFELYSGIEKGDPQPVALEIRLFAETETFENYIAEENLYFRELFTPVNRTSGNNDVLIGVPADNYDRLRDFCYLQRDTRLESTLLFQIDEFWYLRRPGVRRAGTFRSQWEYLHRRVAYKTEEVQPDKQSWIRDWATDPFGLFQPTLEQAVTDEILRRREAEFDLRGYSIALPQEVNGTAPEQAAELIDRVPFMWDFGFLLCNQRQWEKSENSSIPIWSSPGLPNNNLRVGTIWQQLPWGVKKTEQAEKLETTSESRPSWRKFLGACYQVARAESYRRGEPVPAFDCDVIAAQTLSCMVLEIWASEIYEQQKKLGSSTSPQAVLSPLMRRDWDLRVPDESTPQHDPQTPGLIGWLKDYQLELFKTWMLLVEVLDLSGMARAIKQGTLHQRSAHPHAAAVRHWYKTACRATETASLTDPIIPVGLPGHFSVRGDWFLAVAGGSRSNLLADRALDMLNSRRANHTRLTKGLGLPVRRFQAKAALKTALHVLDQGQPVSEIDDNARLRLRQVSYEKLLLLGAQDKPDKEFYWLWRSGLKKYYRHAKIWQEWINSTILWWERVRYLSRDDWMNGFRRYDLIGLAQTDREKNVELNMGLREEASQRSLPAWEIFEKSCQVLLEDLKEATRLTPPMV